MRTRVNYDVRKLDAEVLTFGATDTSDTFSITHTGFLAALIVKVSNLTNSVTATVAMADSDGNEIISQATIAENATTVVHFDFGYAPCYGAMTFTVTLSGVPGGSGGTVTVTPIVM